MRPPLATGRQTRDIRITYPLTADRRACPTCNAVGAEPCTTHQGLPHPRRPR